MRRKVACGEGISFEKLYARCKSQKDISDMRLLLEQAPEYVGGLQGMEAQNGLSGWISCTQST